MEKSSRLSRRAFVQRTLGTGVAIGAPLILGATAVMGRISAYTGQAA